jgi:hypothetical protein
MLSRVGKISEVERGFVDDEDQRGEIRSYVYRAGLDMQPREDAQQGFQKQGPCQCSALRIHHQA